MTNISKIMTVAIVLALVLGVAVWRSFDVPADDPIPVPMTRRNGVQVDPVSSESGRDPKVSDKRSVKLDLSMVPTSGDGNFPEADRSAQILEIAKNPIVDAIDWETHGDTWLHALADLNNPNLVLEKAKACGSETGGDFKTMCAFATTYVLRSHGDGSSTVVHAAARALNDPSADCEDFAACMARARLGGRVRSKGKTADELSALSVTTEAGPLPPHMYNADLLKQTLALLEADMAGAKNAGLESDRDYDRRYQYEEGQAVLQTAQNRLKELEARQPDGGP